VPDSTHLYGSSVNPVRQNEINGIRQFRQSWQDIEKWFLIHIVTPFTAPPAEGNHPIFS
jgi:hypothetical protein